LNFYNHLRTMVDVFRESGQVHLPRKSRPSMIEFLDLLLVDDDRLRLFSALLAAFPGWEAYTIAGDIPRWLGPEKSLTAADEQAVLDRQWLKLSDEVIAGLVLSPTTLRRLNERIRNEFPIAWWYHIDAASEEMLDRLSTFLWKGE
jgi:hypothetical protein